MNPTNKNAKDIKDLEKELDLSNFLQEDESKIKAIFNDDYQNRFIIKKDIKKFLLDHSVW